MSLNYLVIRLAQIVPTFFLIMVIVFVLVHLLPGDPTSALLGIHATDEAVNRINEQLGLNRSIPVQFLFFLRSFFQGDLGKSIVLKVSVTRLIIERLPVTLFLTGLRRRAGRAAGGAHGHAVPRCAATASWTGPSAPASRSASPCRSSISASCC